MIYLDNAATTIPLPDVISAMTDTMMNVYGNPSSTYQVGRQAKKILDESRTSLAISIGATSDELIFTSGGTESNNFALHSLAYRDVTKKHIITSIIEHPSVLNTVEELEKKGFDVTYLPVDKSGVISIQDVKNAIRPDTSFISVMYVNNEVGTVQPIEQIAELLKDKDILLHTDAVQAYGILPIDVKKLGADMLSVSSHKVHGPRGTGFVFVKKGVRVQPLLHGGGQEQGVRSGTENVASIAGFAKAISQLHLTDKQKHIVQLQETLLSELSKTEIDYEVNGSMEETRKVPTIVNVWFKGIPASKLLIQLDLSGIMVSAGSACSAGSLKPSRILLSMFQDEKRASESLRISFSEMNTLEEIKTLVETLKKYAV
ncbi:cysteine desulfurase [Carnobacteriaceae bacterium zg-ZUI78]|nr:cysteine desulfurase [Carnobacteriaceae bacterium zg-ZUI78]